MDRLIGNGNCIITEVGITGVMATITTTIPSIEMVGRRVEVTGTAVDGRGRCSIAMRITGFGSREGLETAVSQVVDGLGVDTDRMDAVSTGTRSVVVTVVTGVTIAFTDPAAGSVGRQGGCSRFTILVTAVIVTVTAAVVTERHIRSVVHVVGSGIAVTVRAVVVV